MKTTTFSQFRNNAKKFFDAVEKGETIQIFRHGKPIALLSPANHQQDPEHWSKVSPIWIRGISLSQVILGDRKKAR